MKKIALFFVLFSLCGVGFASPNQDRKKVRDFLIARKKYGLGLSDKPVLARQLKPLGDKALPLLAECLTDSGFASDAKDVMLEIDLQKSAPLFFHSMPKSDRDVQRSVFDVYVLYIRSGHPFAYSRAMHDAAVRCLEANTPADTAESALLAIGLTGSRSDFPLLTRYFGNKFSDVIWQQEVRHAAGASLARLGSQKHLDNIAHALKAAVPGRESRVPIPARERREQAQELTRYIRDAAFSNNKLFIPLLGKYLYAPDPPLNSDVQPAEPAQEAANALDQLINKASPNPNNEASLDFWRKWWAKSARK